MNKKILISLSVIGAVAAIAVGGTIAYFSDTETSTGNTFTAGTLDLKVDSTCEYNGVQKGFCTWGPKDLTDELFFKFNDVKPGDSGEDTISLKAKDNDAYLCGYVQNLANNDNGLTEPESKVDITDGVGNGELQNNLYMTIWLDVSDQSPAVPCDNVWQPEELVLVNNVPIDSNNIVWPLGQLVGDVKTCLGLAWSVPVTVGNEIQSDSVTGDISFYVEQVRNNPSFTCPTSLPVEPTPSP
jgi:predicted ribosomally synthesized peptide with SipW-like signal peptide